MQGYPKVLIISNECISSTSSNGRTLRNFLAGWPKEKLAQFCIRNTAPDYTVCDHYYYVPDRAALKSFLTGKYACGKMIESTVVASTTAKGIGRDPVSMLFRNLVWSSMRWAGKPFYHWVEAFHPDLILLQAGDCAFMLNLARRLAKKYGIPLIIYNSEAYYFKDFDYFRSSGIRKLFYPIFHRHFCRAFEKCIGAATKTIYCCDTLKEDYDRRFGLPSEVIYTATQMTPADREKDGTLKIAYLGNLGVGRHEGLVEIGEALQKISPDLKLDAYGKIPNKTVQDAFDSCSGVSYKGFVSYEQVVKIMQESDILVHTESFSDFYREDLKYAFSTKIADCLASGTCFLLFAPEGMASTEYLRKNEAAWVVSDRKDLQTVLEQLCSDRLARERYLAKAATLTREKHSYEKCGERFQQILRECVKED